MSINPLAAVSAASSVVDSVRDLIPDVSFGNVLSGADAALTEPTAISKLTADEHSKMVDRLRQLIADVMDRTGIPRDPPVTIEIAGDGRLSTDPADPRAAQLLDRMTQDDAVTRLARKTALPSLPLTLVIDG